MLRIRQFQDSDSIVELTALLHLAYARLGAMGMNFTAVDQTPEVTANRIRGGTCFVVDDGTQLVGTVLAKHNYTEHVCEYFTRPGVAIVHQLAVHPEHQGAGIGRMLLDHAEKWAIDSGCAEVAVDTAEPATHLVELYSRLGYKHVGFFQWPGKVYRSVVLSKPLPASA